MDPISATAAASAAAAAPVAARTLLSMEEEEMTSDQIQCRCAGLCVWVRGRGVFM
jgi:hypothetical protein